MDVESGRADIAETLIFINYRTSDAGTPAAFLHAELSRRFGVAVVFLDYESLPLGRDYEHELLSRVRSCAVLLAVIADRWLEGVVGQRPIDDPDDWVRREILEALGHGVPVVPVLFSGAKLPVERLPAELAVLSKLQHFEIRSRWQRHDINNLADHLNRRLAPSYGFWAEGLRSALVRFRGESGVLVGAGLLVGQNRVVTCAQVVERVLDAVSGSNPMPSGVILVEFPLLGDGEAVPVVECALIRRQPLRRDGAADAAVLRLLGDAPPGAVPPPLEVEEDVEGHRFRVCGSSAGHDDGSWVSGEFRATKDAERFELEVDQGRALVGTGFDGAPVWDETTCGVAGLVVTASDSGKAFLLPVSALRLTSSEAVEPFRGLDAFGIEDAEFFHGRDEEIRRLLTIVRTRSLVVVAGPSGSGKSSLVRAGLLAHLRDEGMAVSELQRTPGVGATATVADLLAGLGDGDRLGAREQIRQRLVCGDEEIALVAADVTREVGGPGAVMFLDQFEEVVAEDPAVARELLRLLVRLLATQSRRLQLHAVVTLRSGSLDELLTTELAGVLEHGVTFVSPMDAESLRAAVVHPVRVAGGVAFEDGLVARVLADAGAEPGRLPLVEFTLTELWRRRRGGRLTHAAYDEIGGVSGALAQYAEHRLWQELSRRQREWARRLLSRLARPAEDGGFIRCRVRISELDDDARTVMNELAATRLVVVNDSGKVVELAHQALVEQWPRLRNWLQADREFLAWSVDLTQRRVQWEDDGRDRRSLLRGAALARAREWRTQRGRELNQEEHAFIARSHAHARRGAWAWRTAGILGIIVALVVSLLAIQTAQQRDQLDAALQDANATVLAQEANRFSEASATALQFAQAAWRERPGNPDALGALWNQYLRWQGVDHISPPTDIPSTNDASSSSDGNVVAMAGGTGQYVVLWLGQQTRKPRQARVPIPSALSDLAVSPDGHFLAVGGSAGDVTVWRTDGRVGPPWRLQQPRGDVVGSVRFNATSQLLAVTSSHSGEVQLWDVESRQRVPSAVQLPSDLSYSSVVPAPDGKTMLATYSSMQLSQPPTILVDVSTGAVLRDYPYNSAIADSGTAIATCESGIVRVRAIVDGADKTPDPPPRCTSEQYLNANFDLTGQFMRLDDTMLFSSAGNETYLHLSSGRRYTINSPYSSGLHLTGAGSLSPGGGFTLLLPISDALVRLHAQSPSPTLEQVALDQLTTEPTISPDGKNWIAATKNDLVLFDSASGVERARAQLPASAPYSDNSPTLRFTLNGERILAASRQELRVYRVAKLELENVVALPRASDTLLEGVPMLPKPGIATLSNGQVAILDRDQLTWWQLGTGRLLGKPIRLPTDPTLPPKSRQNIILSRPRHPEQVIVDMGTTLAVWDLAKRRQLVTMPNHTTGMPGEVAVNATGSRLVATNADQNRIDQWDLDASVPLPAIASDADSIVGFSREFIISSTINSGIQLWRAPTGTRLGPPINRPEDFGRVYVRDDDLVSISDNVPESGTYAFRVATLSLDPRIWFRYLCSINDRSFTSNELSRLPQRVNRDRPCVAQTKDIG